MKTSHQRPWIAITSIILVILISTVGAIFYLNFFRQTNAYLVETVPSEASFILQINDNESFVKTTVPVLSQLEAVLSLDVLPGIEFFIEKLSSKNNKVIISAHHNGERSILLVSCKINESQFKNLLKSLRIDPRNFTPFDQAKIYSYGTHFKKFNFTFHNNFFTISEDIEWLKKSIVQLKHPRNLLSNKEFASLHELMLKNEKQNWLILNHPIYFQQHQSLLSKPYQPLFKELATLTKWSIFQIRIFDKELILSGYFPDSAPFFQKFKNQKAIPGSVASIVPFGSYFYSTIKTPSPDQYLSHFLPARDAKQEDAVQSFEMLYPLSCSYFTLKKDSSVYHYLAIEADTIHGRVGTLIDSIADAPSWYREIPIRKSNIHSFNSLLPVMYKDASTNYFLPYKDYYIFSDTTTSLQYYIQQINQSSIGEQLLYKFSKSNLPSESNYEFCFIALEKEALPGYFSPEGKKNSFIKDVQVFSYTFSAPLNGYIPVSVYIKLQ